MYQIYVLFDCLSGKREAFVERMKEEGILSAIRAEDGCLRYDYFFSESDPNQLLLIEAWETKGHQQVHMEQPHMKRLGSFKEEYIADTRLGEFEIL